MPQNTFGGRKAKALKYLALTSTALVGLGQPIAATAADIWFGTTSTDWFTAGNWSAGSVPTAADIVYISTTTPNPTAINAGSAFADDIYLGFTGSSDGSLVISNGTLTSGRAFLSWGDNSTSDVTVNAGSSWTSSSSLVVGSFGLATLDILNGGVVTDVVGIVAGGSNAQGVVKIDGAGSMWLNSDSLTVGGSGVGAVTVSNGGKVSSDSAYIGRYSGSTGSVTIDDATWTNNGALYVGHDGDGELVIKNGGVVSNADGIMGYSTDSNSQVIVAGAGSTWANSGSLTVGDSGKGFLVIDQGGAVSDDLAHVGNAVGSTGIVFVDGAGSTWTNSSALFVGEQGTGALAITNGGAVNSDLGFVGYGVDSVGTVAVDGAGSKWTNSSDLFVGGGGTGKLTISNGGAVSSAKGYVGYNSTGTVTVDGAGSKWTNSSDLFIGGFDTGSLTISNGGTASNGGGYLGYAADSAGTVAVGGAGSKWTNSGDLYVGGFGTGALTISNGGAVSNGSGFVGYTADSAGTVFVDGAGSTWTNSGDLYIGKGGAGTLHVSNGGAVSDVNGLVAVDTDSSGAVTVDGPGSTWTNSGYLEVDGNGTLAITQGGTVTSSSGSVGSGPGTTGTATIDGVGSNWTVASSLILGVAGDGVLAISNGGLVSDVNGLVGYYGGSSALATVDGSGSKWLNSGDLSVLSVGTVSVTNGGEITDTNGKIGTNGGDIGTVKVDGTGSKWTNGADLYVGIDGAGTLTVANDGAVTVAGNLLIADQAGSTGTVNIGGAAGAAATGAGVLGSATFQFGLGTGALNFNHTNTNYAFDAGISGLGTINQIAGNTNLTGNSSGFTGATNVSGGRLAVNGSLASSLVTITGGMLGGNGTVGGIVAQSGGIIAPGNSIGTLNVAGNVDQAAGSIYLVELTSTGTSDFLHAAGAATIDSGALIDVVKLDGAPYVGGTHYTVLQADGGVTGTYTFGGNTGTAFLGLVDSYDANHVYLDVVQKTFASVGLTPNQIATGTGAESLGSGNPLFDAIFALPSEAAAQDAFDQLSGEIHASAKGMLLEDSRFIRDAATSRISAAFGDAGSTPALPVMAYGEGGPEMVAADTDRFAVWGQAFGSWGNTDSDGNAAAFDRSTGGLLAGADTQLGTWRVGLLGGYSHSSFDADDRNSSGKNDSYHLGLYGGTDLGAIAFRTGAAYSWNSLSTKRAVAFNGFADGLSADYDAGTAQAFGELAYKADAGHFKFEPFANLAYVSVHTDGFTETGGAAALTSAGSTTDATFTTLGLRASTDLGLGEIKATARGMLGWRHAFGDDIPTSSFAFAGGDLFTIAGVPVARDAAVVEAGLDLNMSANATLKLSYTGQFGGGTVDQGAKVNLGLRF
ncbi:autotransporter outer membrane beta-barrel domain-containing protein [Mesorhizobium sp. M0051]|uniref:autotransporter outer membrane beta-barrel domain-containing protein n=1 Tax=unclassified Mesorhizobium TaxID=325217 RepID=UPI0003CEDAA4|nr:autotransporter domain-containing protein [Mesorhizobium sp. LNHC252B00]ESY72056.1 transporter [Mesorhizobium sp. LNHC252B00]